MKISVKDLTPSFQLPEMKAISHLFDDNQFDYYKSKVKQGSVKRYIIKVVVKGDSTDLPYCALVELTQGCYAVVDYDVNVLRELLKSSWHCHNTLDGKGNRYAYPATSGTRRNGYGNEKTILGTVITGFSTGNVNYLYGGLDCRMKNLTVEQGATCIRKPLIPQQVFHQTLPA